MVHSSHDSKHALWDCLTRLRHHDGASPSREMSRSLLNYVAIVVKLEGPHPDRQLLMRVQSSEALVGLDHAGRGPSQGRAGIPPAFDVARDAAMVPIMFSAILVEASDRRSSVGTFNRTTVRISSRPWRMVAATPAIAGRVDARDCGSIFQARRHQAPRPGGARDMWPHDALSAGVS